MVDSCFANTSINSGEILHQYRNQQQIVMASAVDSCFTNRPTPISAVSAVDSQYQQQIATSSIPITSISRQLLHTNIRSRQPLYELSAVAIYMVYFFNTNNIIYQHKVTISSMPISGVDSYFFNTSISSRQLLHQYQYQQQIPIISSYSSSMPISAVDSSIPIIISRQLLNSIYEQVKIQ